jgi:plasmid segregation protein ParM
MSAVIRAIDVGFGNTKFVTASEAGKIECSSFPSLSFFGMSENAGEGLGGKRRTVTVPVNGLQFVVGPEVELAADNYWSRHQHDAFTTSDEYRALMAGALHYMKVDRVDLLVVGLPVAQFLNKRAALERSMTGTFEVGKKKKVEVRKVLVVAQPQGALVDYANSAGSEAIRNGRSLVIDVGSKTFDWLVTRGMKVVGGMSSSTPRGTASILTAIAKKVSEDIKEDFRHYESIDEALRTGRPLRIYQEDYELKKCDKLIQAIADVAVLAMVQSMDATFNVENIVLVGGGAFLYRKAIKRQFPRHKIREVDDPLHANVRGFQLIGEQYAREHPETFMDAQPKAAREEPCKDVAQA